MKDLKETENLYRENPENHRTIIDVALDTYLEFFHEWDNAAFRKRDMHPELAEFLDICSQDIPMRKALEIQFFVNAGELDSKKEQLVTTSFKNYYLSLYRNEKRRVRRILKRSLALMCIALVLILFYAVLHAGIVRALWFSVLLEGLHIGGWVFMWESFHLAFFDSLEPMKRKQEMKRLYLANLRFRCN